MNLTLTDVLARAVAFLLGFGLHEAAHAWVAYRLGDDTAKRAGRLTLNPIVHLDPLGYILSIVAGIGWAKPTPVNPRRLKYGERTGSAIVAVAGPVSNLLLAIIAGLILRFADLSTLPSLAVEVLYWFIWAQAALFVFNLIPLAPLDGISVLRGIVGRNGDQAIQPLYTYGPQILMGLILLGYILPQLDVLGRIVFPAVNGIVRVLLG